jgi:mycothiol synthase
VSVELRPPRREDAPAIADVSRAWGLRDETQAGVEAWFDVPSFDPEHDARVALVDGAVVGWGDVSDASREGKFLWTDVRTDSQHWDAAPVLLDFVEERARALAAPGGMIKAWSPEHADEWRALLESRAYQLHHYSLRMIIGLDEEPPEPEWPQGITVRGFRPDEDERTVYEAHQETFSDQRDFSRDPLEDWRNWSYREPFDPELWFLAIDGEEVAGISLCRPERGGDRECGWVSVVGVRKPWRRRGLGLALMRHSFRELRRRGKTRVGLGVDGDNPTGAARLYERAGMTVERRFVWYERPS